ncbi:MAG TPA: TIGR01906 family membrane protein [Eubacteriaceae bacterium]|nr:TIGR01906 family membrane protein [Eubacteriaceae bacterium]
MRKLKKGTYLLLVMIVPIVVLLSQVEVMVKWDSFYYNQYQANQVTQNTGMEMDQLMQVTDKMQDYLLGDRKQFQVEAVVDGESTLLFNEREIIHMDDVKKLFDGGLLIRNIGAVIALGVMAYGLRRRDQMVLQALIYSVGFFFALMGIFALLMTLDFQSLFHRFHEIFFTNDYWILDPDKSVLINMVPLAFFMQMTIRIVLLSTGTMVMIGILSWWGIKKWEEKDGKRDRRIGN